MIPVTHPLIEVPAPMLNLDPDTDYRLSALHTTLYQHVRNRLSEARLNFQNLELDILPGSHVLLRDRITIKHLHEGRVLYFASAQEDHDTRDTIHTIVTHATTEVRALTPRFQRPELDCPQRTFMVLHRPHQDAPSASSGPFTRWSDALRRARTLSTAPAHAWVTDACDAPTPKRPTLP